MATNNALDSIIDVILKNEGGYVNLKEDRGGPTNYGVIQSEYSLYLGRPATIEDVKKMPIAHARDIFKTKYYFKPKINSLPEGLQPVVTDACVLYGPKRAIIFLQKILNAVLPDSKLGTDGAIGPATVKAADDAVRILGANILVNHYCDERIRFCEAIVRNNPSQRIFIKGWIARSNRFRLKA